MPFTCTDTNKSIKDDSLNLDQDKKSRVKEEWGVFITWFWFKGTMETRLQCTKYSGLHGQMSQVKVCQLLWLLSFAVFLFLDDNYGTRQLTPFYIQIYLWNYQLVTKNNFVHRIIYLVLMIWSTNIKWKIDIFIATNEDDLEPIIAMLAHM